MTPEFRETLLTQYSTYLLVDQQYEKVLEVLTSDLALKEPLTPGQLLVRARALIHLRQASFALRDTQEAYLRRGEETLFPSPIDAKGCATESVMAEALYLNGKHEDAIKYFEIALQSSKSELRTLLAYSECLDRIGRIGEAVDYLHQVLLKKYNIPIIWIHGAKLLLRHSGLRNITAEWIAEASRYHPENREIQDLILELSRCENLK